MNEQIIEFYRALLGTKDLPEALEDAFRKFKFQWDRGGGGDIRTDTLLLLAMFAGVLPEPPAASRDTFNTLMNREKDEIADTPVKRGRGRPPTRRFIGQNEEVSVG